MAVDTPVTRLNEVSARCGRRGKVQFVEQCAGLDEQPDPAGSRELEPLIGQSMLLARRATRPLDALKAAVGPRTRLIVLNTPNNPAGTVTDRGTLEALAGI